MNSLSRKSGDRATRLELIGRVQLSGRTECRALRIVGGERRKRGIAGFRYRRLGAGSTTEIAATTPS